MEPTRRQRAQAKAGDGLVAAIEIALQSVTDTVRERLTRPNFAAASEVALGVLDSRIEDVRARTKPGARATQKDMELLAVLKDIRLDIDTGLNERCMNREELGPGSDQ